jgi:hypothetical protein
MSAADIAISKNRSRDAAAGSGPHYASKWRIPPCGRGRSSSSGCELDLVQGVWTCLACNCIAPGNITVPSSWRC